jgi:pilin isopeptide linkage protein
LLEDDVELVLQADGTGLVTFDELVFQAVGTHYYCVLEDELDQNGVITDKTEYIVKVEITDDYNGNLVATVTVDDQEVTGDIADSIVFRNVYKIAAGEIIISGTKKLENADIKDYTFTFELFSGSGAKQQAVTNDELGNFKFNAIPVDSEGEYVFTVREVTEDAEGITYDESEYTVKVIAEDNGDGTYKLTYSYFDDGNEQENIIFVNTYTEPTPDPTPDNDSPLTGNKSNLGLWIALLFVSGIGMFATVFFTEKQKRRS